MDPHGSDNDIVICFFLTFATMKKEQVKLTNKEAVKKVLEELGGRARLRDIYPRVIPLVKYKPGSDIKATLRRLLQTTPSLFRHTEGRKGWWELVSYQEELAEKDRIIAELTNGQITKDVIIKAFDGCDNLVERTYAKQSMQILFRGLDAWETAYKEMKKLAYFKDVQPQVNLNNPQFGSLYEVKDNKKVIIGKRI